MDDTRLDDAEQAEQMVRHMLGLNTYTVVSVAACGLIIVCI